MTKTKDRSLSIFSLLFFFVCIGLTLYGTFFDLDVSFKLFEPQSKFAIGFEAFGQCVLWLMWGPLFSVLFLTRHSLAQYIEIFSRALPFIKPLKSTDSKAYKTLDKIVNVLTGTLFFVLCVIGWEKPIQNILKHMFDINGAVYIVISICAAALSILVFSRLGKEKLKKLEAMAAAGILLGICLKLAEEMKTVTHRVRFREMVAYSNGILDEKMMSHGSFTKLSPVLGKDMAAGADVSAFTRWYIKGNDMGRYAKADSFPSGHVMNSCAIFLSYILCKTSEKLKKFAVLIPVISAAYVAVMGLSRIMAGAHYLTDVSFGMIIGYALFLAAYKFYGYAEKKIG